MMLVNTSRFGEIQIEKTEILNFAEGILGFEELHEFILVEDPTDDVFAWLQSCDSADIAFPVLEPEMFSENYQISLSKKELDVLGLENVSEARFFTIITIPEDPRQMTANMKAPLVLNPKNKAGRQCVLQDHTLNIKEPIFKKLQQRMLMRKPAQPKAGNLSVSPARPRPAEL